jgi:hypothetical protein
MKRTAQGGWYLGLGGGGCIEGRPPLLYFLATTLHSDRASFIIR